MVTRASTFYEQLEAEIIENCDGLTTDDHRYLARYYAAFKNNVRLRSFYRYNWLRRISPMQKLITMLPKRDKPWRMLDAGCGVGTESIFWSMLRGDLEVIGVDISAERLNTAKARKIAYEKRSGRPLNIDFWERDVFEVIETEDFDLVWVMEAISHIDPAEDFLSHVAINIGTTGHLVISDSHILSPAMTWRIYKLRRHGVAERTFKTTSRGKRVSYAQERLFAVGQLSKLLRARGFDSVQTQLSIFFPPQAAYIPPLFELCVKFDQMMNQVPLMRNIGGIYTIVAGKSPSREQTLCNHC